MGVSRCIAVSARYGGRLVSPKECLKGTDLDYSAATKLPVGKKFRRNVVLNGARRDAQHLRRLTNIHREFAGLRFHTADSSSARQGSWERALAQPCPSVLSV